MTRRETLSGFLIEGLAVIAILVMSTIVGCLLASNLEGKLARHCAIELQRGLR
jgi:hypothetical protein